MDLPTVDEIRAAFPGKVPDDITSVVFIEKKPDSEGLYRESSIIEWIGYLKGKVIGLKRFLFGAAGWAQIVVTSVALFKIITSEPAQAGWNAFCDYSKEKITYAQDLASRYMTFGDLPPPQPEGQDTSGAPTPFSKNLATVAVSGHYIQPT